MPKKKKKCTCREFQTLFSFPSNEGSFFMLSDWVAILYIGMNRYHLSDVEAVALLLLTKIPFQVRGAHCVFIYLTLTLSQWQKESELKKIYISNSHGLYKINVLTQFSKM